MTTETAPAQTNAPAGPGRPREFDLDVALAAGVAAFRRDGFEATSLDALTRAMGIGKSSFYAAFGSKRAVLVKALERYSDERIAALEALSAGPDGLRQALRALAGVGQDAHGCLMVNCLTELAPRDPEVAALGARHLARAEAVVAARLPDGPQIADRARALVALALGAQTLRKTASAPDAAEALLDLALPRLAAGG